MTIVLHGHILTQDDTGPFESTLLICTPLYIVMSIVYNLLNENHSTNWPETLVAYHFYEYFILEQQ